jgi:uncharacterized protein YbbC (DUF1343 family)
MTDWIIRSEYRKPLSIFIALLWISIANAQITTGADQPEKYLQLLKGKRVAAVVNQTSCLHKIKDIHLIDFLLKNNINVRCIFAPEHGFRGNHEAGAKIKNDTDATTGLPIYSLYGNTKKPSSKQLENIDIVLFDIQDVGARFYTYISTLHYVMEACAELNKVLLILDRPNPNGFYVDGPVLDNRYSSFVGMHPVPVVHGMTIGEYAGMINGEGWLKNKIKCSLNVVKVENYNHSMKYTLPIAPSPNLRNMTAIYLYPTLCFLEGTSYSLGRGTVWPFECAGKPNLNHGDFIFKPTPIKGVADNPPHANKECRGYRYSNRIDSAFFSKPEIMLDILTQLYNNDPDTGAFFNTFFDKLAGNALLRLQIIDRISPAEIRLSWQPGLIEYKKTRAKYLLYP